MRITLERSNNVTVAIWNTPKTASYQITGLGLIGKLKICWAIFTDTKFGFDATPKDIIYNQINHEVKP